MVCLKIKRKFLSWCPPYLDLSMLPVAYYAKRKWCKKIRNDWNPGTWVIIWEYSARAIWWILTWQGLDGFQKSLRLCSLDESSISIGRVIIIINITHIIESNNNTIKLKKQTFQMLLRPFRKSCTLSWFPGYSQLPLERVGNWRRDVPRIWNLPMSQGEVSSICHPIDLWVTERDRQS